MSENMCSCNRSRDYDALLERYERLKQVAKGMYKAMHRPYTLSDTKVYEKTSFRKQLEDCGVNLDD